MTYLLELPLTNGETIRVNINAIESFQTPFGSLGGEDWKTDTRLMADFTTLYLWAKNGDQQRTLNIKAEAEDVARWINEARGSNARFAAIPAKTGDNYRTVDTTRYVNVGYIECVQGSGDSSTVTLRSGSRFHALDHAEAVEYRTLQAQ